jgi:hypothetical protein
MRSRRRPSGHAVGSTSRLDARRTQQAQARCSAPRHRLPVLDRRQSPAPRSTAAFPTPASIAKAYVQALEKGYPPIGDEARRHVETPARERRRFGGPSDATDEVGGVPPYSPALAPVGSIARDTGPSASGEPHGRNRRPEEAAAVRKAQLRPLSDSRRRCEGLAVRAAARRRGGTSAEERRSAPARTPIASALVNGSIRTCRGSRLHLSSIETSAVSTSSGPVSDARRASSPMRGGPRKRKSHSRPGPPGRTGSRSAGHPAP